MTMPTIFDVTVSPEDGAEPFVPTADDLIEWVICDDCGEEFPTVDGLGSCDCHMGMSDSEGDFPLYMEYEGVTGLAGYDSFYDNDSDLTNEW
jgi:hypothetical protein